MRQPGPGRTGHDRARGERGDAPGPPESPPADPTRTWLRRFGWVDRPAARLVCFPHAGGTASFYRPWRDHLPAGIELFAVQYPGRLDRLGDPGIDDMDRLADAVTAAVSPLQDLPVALFGHSLGASVAYEVARRLGHTRPPAQLFVSGRAAPGLQSPSTKHLASDEALWSELARLGGTRPEVIADPVLREVFLPALRNDYRLAETYRPAPGAKLTCPLMVLRGCHDAEVARAAAEAWAGFTEGDVEIREFPGEHFYLITRVPELVAEVAQRLMSRITPASHGRAGV